MNPRLELDRNALSQDEAIHWLALRMMPGLGTKTSIRLLERLRTPAAIFRASVSELEASGVPTGLAQSIVSGCSFEEAATQHQRLMAVGAVLLPYTHAQYPPLLREIYDPPPVLFARGRRALLDELKIGVIGTRHPTAYGTAVAGRLARDLAMAGLTIVSGMARGIDTAAHKAALEVEGDTIAVFGCGVDEVYPAENRKLAGQIAEKGLVLSEFPMGAPPYPQNFPIRNRIISGMSLGVVVVEGGEYSGSSITAKLAAEQGREIFAVPGNVTSKMSWGPNLLIKQGAKLVQEWTDVVTEFKAEDRRKLADRKRKLLNLNDVEEESPREVQSSLETGLFNAASRAVLGILKTDAPVTLDHLVDSIDTCTASEIMAALFELELGGLVRQLPGKSFLKVWSD
jgi:DNA processing protein